MTRPDTAKREAPVLPMPAAHLVVLRHLAAGLNLKEIAVRLGITQSAVNMRATRMREYLGAATSEQAVYEATLRGLLKGVPRP